MSSLFSSQATLATCSRLKSNYKHLNLKINYKFNKNYYWKQMYWGLRHHIFSNFLTKEQLWLILRLERYYWGHCEVIVSLTLILISVSKVHIQAKTTTLGNIHMLNWNLAIKAKQSFIKMSLWWQNHFRWLQIN